MADDDIFFYDHKSFYDVGNAGVYEESFFIY